MISFQSETARKLLGYFFMNESEAAYVNELVLMLGIDKRNMVKKLKEFEKEGLFISERRGNQKYYRINTEYSLYDEYKKIFLKTAGVEHELRKVLKETKGVSRGFIFGSYAENNMNAGSDIDVLIIGDHSVSVLQKSIFSIQKALSREINCIHLSDDEFKQKSIKDAFIKRILNGTKVELV